MIFTTCKCEKKFHFKTVYIWCASRTDEVELLRTLCLCTFRLVLPKVQLSRPIVVVVLSFLRADNYWIMYIGVCFRSWPRCGEFRIIYTDTFCFTKSAVIKSCVPALYDCHEYNQHTSRVWGASWYHFKGEP